jgi:hypothetical protein
VPAKVTGRRKAVPASLYQVRHRHVYRTPGRSTARWRAIVVVPRAMLWTRIRRRGPARFVRAAPRRHRKIDDSSAR